MYSRDRLKQVGLFDARAPRYTSYPPANHFNDNFDVESGELSNAELAAQLLAALEKLKTV